MAESEKDGKVWIPGGNSGVLINGTPYSNKGGSCIRKIMLRNEHVKEPIDFRSKITFGVGNAIEDLYADYLKGCGHTVETSVRCSSDITDTQVYLDETDMVVDGIPCEIKSVVSTKKLKEVFCENKASWDNVVQAAHHMIQFKSMVGKLVYICGCWHTTTYKKESISFKSGDIKEFNLKFSEKTGGLSVNGVKFPFGTKNLLQWRKWAGAFVEAQDLDAVIPTHPGILIGEKRPPEFRDSVCRWCYWKEVCNTATNYNDFIFLAKELVTIKGKK